MCLGTTYLRGWEAWCVLQERCTWYVVHRARLCCAVLCSAVLARYTRCLRGCKIIDACDAFDGERTSRIKLRRYREGRQAVISAQSTPMIPRYPWCARFAPRQTLEIGNHAQKQQPRPATATPKKSMHKTHILKFSITWEAVCLAS